jgi:hypothetical protein
MEFFELFVIHINHHRNPLRSFELIKVAYKQTHRHFLDFASSLSVSRTEPRESKCALINIDF